MSYWKPRTSKPIKRMHKVITMIDERVCELIDRKISRLPSLGRTAAPGKYVVGRRDKTL